MNNRLFKPYFAHPINLYGTPLNPSPLERSLSLLIASHFDIPEYDVENPNQPHHQEGYKTWATRAASGMSYFYDQVLPGCDGCVAVPFLDGRMGLGVAGETKWYIEKGLPVFLIYAKREVTSSALREFEIVHRSGYRNGLFGIRPLTAEEQELVVVGDPRIVVSHEETRLRIFRVYGKESRPFEESHLVSMPVPPGFYPDKK